MPGPLQAYFEFDQVLACSDALDPRALVAALPASDGLRVSVVEGIGLVAARRVGDFTHVVAGQSDAIELFDADFWRDSIGPLELEVDRRPFDLGFLADAPPGVATRLLDAALAGPVVFTHPDEHRRAAWIAWLTYALPDGADLTFSTNGEPGVRIVAAAEAAEAIDTTRACDLTPTLYARVAHALALRGELRPAVARLEEADGLALAVYGGATDLIAPHQLPLALQLITELATAGEVALAARAAAALPSGPPSTDLVLHEHAPVLPEPIVPESDEILDAEVVEQPEESQWADVLDAEVIEVPFEIAEPKPEPEEPESLPPGPLDVLGDDEVVEVPFEVVEAEEDELPDLDAWSSLLSELKAESVEPDEDLPSLPDIDELRRRERLFGEPVAPPEPEPELEPEPEPEPEPVAEEPTAETPFENGMALDAFAASLSQAPEPVKEPAPAVEEEVGMSVSELEASISPPAPRDQVVEEEVGMSLAELEASLKRGEDK